MTFDPEQDKKYYDKLKTFPDLKKAHEVRASGNTKKLKSFTGNLKTQTIG